LAEHSPSFDTFWEVPEPEDVQDPKPDWQPVPQYALVEPHQPFALQQFPKAEFKHV